MGINKEALLLQLLSIDGIGNVAVKNLIDHFENIENIFKAKTSEISLVAGLNKKKADNILRLQGNINLDALKEIKQKGYKLYCYGDKDYPELLAEIYDPPMLLYSNGQIKETDFNAVAIVGTRRASEYGRNAARSIAKKLAANNITVVSGCAVGIDTCAHQGALEGGGRTIAVLGCGLNENYPRQNIRLMDRISANGAVISEYPLNTKPASYNFPRRNRIISGLSRGVVVVEAPGRSGALITAYQAIDQGREVYSVPGSIFSSKSRGCIDLIKRGAITVSDAEDIIKDLEPVLDKSLLKRREEEFIEEKISERGKKILKVLSCEPLHIDKITTLTKIDVNVLAKELTNLEIIGKINQVGGKRYIKNG